MATVETTRAMCRMPPAEHVQFITLIAKHQTLVFLVHVLRDTYTLYALRTVERNGRNLENDW